MESPSSPTAVLAMFNLSGWELVILGVILLLIFGRKVPDIARSLGKGVVEFKKGLRDVHDAVEQPSQPQQYQQNQGNPAPPAQFPSSAETQSTPSQGQSGQNVYSQGGASEQSKTSQNPYQQGDFRKDS
ncbi:MAG: hypothetical protein EXS00_08390 [Phycisphaerales bacterium]|nr:hypothetical protein [Phycisphaerales bacterium]